MLHMQYCLQMNNVYTEYTLLRIHNYSCILSIVVAFITILQQYISHDNGRFFKIKIIFVEIDTNADV